MRYSSHATSHIGTRREANQDVILIDEDLGVYIICDGMGGTSAGGVAANLAAKICLGHLRGDLTRITDITHNRLPSHHLTEVAQAAIHAANQAVHAHTQERAELRGSGTTIALLITAGNHGVCAHVGDSRVYAFRNQQFFQLTKDHSLAQDLIDRGLLDKDKVESFAFKHVLSRAVGLLPAVSIDTLHFEILPGDRFLLASDGVSAAVAEAGLKAADSHHDSKELLGTIISSALASNSGDDLSALLVEAQSDERDRHIHHARSEEFVLKTSVLRDVFLFQSLDPQNIIRIVNAAALIECPAGSSVVLQGEPDSSLYIILSGTFNIEINGQKIAQLHRGNHFGEMALLTNHTRSATVRAATKGKVLRLAAEDFQRFLQAHPQDGVRMMTALAQELSERLRQTNHFLAQRT